MTGIKSPFDEKEFPFVAKGHQYALDIISGKITACVYMTSFCNKYLRDLNDDRFIFDADWSERFLRMFQRFEHVIGEWGTKNIVLEPWQCFMFMVAEGFYWKRNGKRKYKTLWCEVARGNGKSAIASGTGLIYLSLYRTVKGNKVYAAATKKEQSRIVLDSAREMAKNNKSYLQHTGTKVYAHHIGHDATGSEFRALSSDSNSLDGLQPVLGIVDEVHAHKDRGVFDVIDTAMSKRSDSLLLGITTAGFSLEGIGYSQSCYAKKVALGEIKDETFLPLLYTLDENDDPYDESVWIKANPNLEVSVDIDSFRSKAFKAQANPQDEINFLVKHLNLWQNAASQFFNIKKWKSLGDKSLKLYDFVGEKCYVGIDLASKKDLTSFTYVFKRDGLYYFFTEAFLPEGALRESKNVNYQKWADEGTLIVTKGNAINYKRMGEYFIENSKKFKILGANYDPWNATEFSQGMTEHRIEMVEFRMSTANMSEPMKRLDSLILEEKIRHDGSELVEWCLGNVVAKYDHNDNVFPRKEHEAMKIDPVISMIMGLATWILEEQTNSIYESRGILIM